MARTRQTLLFFLLFLYFLTLDFVFGPTFPSCSALQKTTTKTGPSKGTFWWIRSSSYSISKWRKVHGILSFVSWGILNPVGVLIVGVFKRPPIWIYFIHACFQTISTVLGIFGWIIGITIGSKSHEVKFNIHLIVGNTVTCLSTAQILILLLKPNEDHKYKKCWNYCHNGLGYIITIFGCFNVSVGINNSRRVDDNWILPWIFPYRIWMGALCVFGSGKVIGWIHGSCTEKSSGPVSPTQKEGYGMVNSPTKSGMQLSPLDSVKIGENNARSPSSS